MQATKLVKAEQQAELAEFDEDIPWDEKEAERKQLEDESMVERELTMIDNELSPVERYAVIFMETQLSDQTQEQLKQAEVCNSSCCGHAVDSLTSFLQSGRGTH